MTTKREFLERVVKELNLDVRDPLTLLIANACALADLCDELRAQLAARSTPPEERLKDDVPLKCSVVDGAIQFLIGEKVLANATNICPRLYDAENDRGRYRVTDSAKLAEAVAHELNREREDGSTLLTDAMDDAVGEAIEQGCEGVEENEAPPSPLGTISTKEKS